MSNDNSVVFVGDQRVNTRHGLRDATELPDDPAKRDNHLEDGSADDAGDADLVYYGPGEASRPEAEE